MQSRNSGLCKAIKEDQYVIRSSESFPKEFFQVVAVASQKVSRNQEVFVEETHVRHEVTVENGFILCTAAPLFLLLEEEEKDHRRRLRSVLGKFKVVLSPGKDKRRRASFLLILLLSFFPRSYNQSNR